MYVDTLFDLIFLNGFYKSLYTLILGKGLCGYVPYNLCISGLVYGSWPLREANLGLLLVAAVPQLLGQHFSPGLL